MRVYSHEFRMQVVRRIRNGEKVPALSRELGVHRKVLYEWMRRVDEGGESNLRKQGRPPKSEIVGRAASTARQVAELERTVARQQLAIEFLEICLNANRDVTPPDKEDWRHCIFRAVEEMTQRQGGLSVETMCKLARVPRNAYYRYLRTRETSRC